MNEGLPSPGLQREFWNEWNREHRGRDELDGFMARQRACAVACASAMGMRGGRILDLGCGTGWLGEALRPFGAVTGTDLSPDAIEEGRRRHPQLTLLCGDFGSVDLRGPFDLIVSADVIAHVPDQVAFVARVAALLRSGGTFLLMTQNPVVWSRRSSLRPRADGQIRNWPPLARIRKLLAPLFRIERVSSIVPGGDRGMLWWVENRRVRGAMSKTIGLQRWNAVLERALLGRELVVEARRR